MYTFTSIELFLIWRIGYDQYIFEEFKCRTKSGLSFHPIDWEVDSESVCTTQLWWVEYYSQDSWRVINNLGGMWPCFLDIILRYSFWGIRFRSIDQPFRCSGDSNHPQAARVTWLNDNETLALRFVRPETLPRRRARWSKGLRTHILLFLHGRFNGRFNGRFDGDQYQTMFILDG